MRPIVTRGNLLTAVVAVVLALPLSRPAASPSAGRTALTREALEAAAVTRVGDIIRLIDDWGSSSTDGYTWKAATNGLSTFQGQHWIVMLDGQRMDLKLFDAVNLNMLPVPLDQIDSVVVINTPQLHGGEFTDKGLIHFYTRLPRRGETYQARFMGGGESGDPGPYRYTRYRTVNIDADGPDGSVGFGIARDHWTFFAGALVQHFYFTDPALRPRTTNILGTNPVKAESAAGAAATGTAPASRLFDTGADDTWPGMLRHGASAGFSYRGASAFLHPFVGYSKAQKYYLYSEPFGREMPTDNRYLHAGINGEFYTARSVTLGYRLHYSSTVLSKHDNALGFDYDWDARRAGLNAWLAARGSSAGVECGGGVDRTSVKTGDALDDKILYIGKAYGAFSLSPSWRHAHRAGLMTTFSRAAASWKAFWNWGVEINRRQAVEAACSYSQRDFAENDDVWYWTGEGYRLLERTGVTYTIPDEIDKTNTAAADVTWRICPGAKFAIAATGLYRRFSGVYVEQRSFVLDTTDCSLASPTEVVAGLEGQAAGVRLLLTYAPSPRFEGKLYFRHLETYSGDGLLEREWKTVGGDKIVAQIILRPYDDVSAWIRMTHLSSATWEAYREVKNPACSGGENSATYSPDVGGSATLDVKIRKLLLDKKLYADLICRNLWDADNRYHPAGASFDLSFYLLLGFTYHSD